MILHTWRSLWNESIDRPFSKSYNSNRYWNKGTKRRGSIRTYWLFTHSNTDTFTTSLYNSVFNVSTHHTSHRLHNDYTLLQIVTHWESEKNLHIPLVFTRCFKNGLFPKSVHEFSQMETVVPSWSIQTGLGYRESSVVLVYVQILSIHLGGGGLKLSMVQEIEFDKFVHQWTAKQTNSIQSSYSDFHSQWLTYSFVKDFL